MADELTLENLQIIAAQAGLRLVDDELHRLLPGVNRARKQASELRELVGPDDELAGTFDASANRRK